MNHYLTQNPNTLPGIINGIGPLGQPGGAESTFTSLLSRTIGLMTIIAFIYFLFVLITGAIGVIGAGGDKGKIEDARGRITTGVIGVVVVVAAMFIMDLVARILGIPGMLNLNALISNIAPP